MLRLKSARSVQLNVTLAQMLKPVLYATLHFILNLVYAIAIQGFINHRPHVSHVMTFAVNVQGRTQMIV